MTTSVLAARDLGPAPEKEVATDLVRRGAMVLPVAALVAGLVWGWDGVASVGFAGALVLANFWVAAALLTWSARISLGLLMGVSLFGFVLRLGLISLAVLGVAGQPWVQPWPLGITLVVCHLGLLLWETKYVSASLAFPGLTPGRPKE